MTAVVETSIPELGEPWRGKVRDVYALGANQLLIVATDRISAFDHVLGSPIPGKGIVLSQMSLFWFGLLEDLVPNHVLTADVSEYPAVLAPYHELLAGRSMIVRKAEMIPVECVARGYLAGSGWRDYQATGAVCGLALPPGLSESSPLPEPLFTPATKAQGGAHDENIPLAEVVRLIGAELAEQLRKLTLTIYCRAAEFCRERGLLLADTKLEFGLVDGRLVLADEVLTPDSSRYWLAASYATGGPQPSFDKQYVRDYLESIQWDKRPPAPALPPVVVERTRQKYEEAFRRLTGHACPGL